jgi:serine protease inhibitor
MSAGISLKAMMLLLLALPFSPAPFAQGTIAPTGQAADKTVAPRYNHFGLNVFKKIVTADSGRNVFVSPASAAMALAMVYNGAEGITQEEMRRALELEGLTLDDVNQANAVLRDQLKKVDSNVVLTIANSIWINQSLPVRQEFLDRTGRSFDAAIRPLDFSDPGSVKTINDWVNAATRGRIPDIVDSIDPDDVMFLINAIYFKGLWKYPFDKNVTRERDFALPDGNKVKTPLMERTDKFDYIETDDFQAIGLPYGDGHLSMLVFLPAADHALSRFVSELTFEKWQEWASALGRYGARREGTIALPRLKMEYQAELNRTLQALGMRTAFMPDSANFAGLWERREGVNVFVSKVKQKTFLEVNEEGSEAAAVTSVEMRMTSTAVETTARPFEMIVDRPFFCAIVNWDSGLTLFMGAIVDPR